VQGESLSHGLLTIEKGKGEEGCQLLRGWLVGHCWEGGGKERTHRRKRGWEGNHQKVKDIVPQDCEGWQEGGNFR